MTDLKLVDLQELVLPKKEVSVSTDKFPAIKPFTEKEEEDASDFQLAELVADYYYATLRTDGICFYMNGPEKWEKLSTKAKKHWKLVKHFLRRKCSNKPSRSKKRLLDVLACLHAEESMFVAPEVWDSCPTILNTPAGIVDLNTGELSPRRPIDYVTMVTRCSPVPGPTPKFDKFMAEIFSEEDWGEHAEEVRDFVLGVLSLALSGEQIEQKFFFLYGSGANGKSVLLDLIRRLLGDYAQTLATDALTAAGSSNKGYAVAGLKGLRLATASEVGRTDRWDEALIKQLTGEKELAVRQIWGEYGEIDLQATLMVSGNHKPKFHGGDGGMVRRIVMIPFKASIPQEKQNRFLCEELIEEEGAAILSKLVERCMDVRHVGVDVPDCIRAETEDYVQENDDIQSFFDDYLELMHNNDVYEPTEDVYEAYRYFKKQRGEQPLSSPVFNQEVTAKFNIKKQRKRIGGSGNPRTCFLGIRLTKSKDIHGVWK